MEGALLFVAAERLELSGLASRCHRARKLRWGLTFSAAGECGGGPVVLVANGPGVALVSQAVERALAKAAVRAVVSTGYCGALDPALRVGDIVVASRVDGAEGSYPARMPWTGRACRSGVVRSVARVVRTVEEKRALRAGGAVAVEMEAAAVAEQAARAGLPFFCIRSVLDRADEGFTFDFNELRSPDGRFNRIRIAGTALASPRLAGELFRLGRNCRRAARNLGEFLGDCRFEP